MLNQTIPLTRNRLAAALLGLGLFLAVFSTGRANSYYRYIIDTSAISGQSGNLAFDFINGDAVTNNSVFVTGLSTNGTLSDSSNFSLTDTSFFNEVLRDIVFGSTLSFNFQLTSNYAGGTPDSFAFYLLDDTASFTLFPTSDPLGTDALFAVDIDGSVSGSAGVYAGTLAVPESGSALALGGLAFGLLVFARRFSNRHTVT
jgi:hypothetical protein